MAQFYPVILPGGASLQGASLGFHAYSLRIDNLTNQWLLEETSLAWIPPYSLGTCLRLYGTSVALLINRAPTAQLQLGPIAGEEAVGVYSDQLRTEVSGQGIRQFTLVQAVSDLTEGPQPALPPAGVDRLYADTSGRIHHVHSDGTDLILVDPSQVGVVTSAMILDGTIAAADMAAGAAAGNVGALGGVLTGSLPNPGLAVGSVTSAAILDGTIAAVDLAAGAAAASIGALGGQLTGSLPNPDLALSPQYSAVINDTTVPAGTPTLVGATTIGTAGRYLVQGNLIAQNTSGVGQTLDAYVALNGGGTNIATVMVMTAVVNAWGVAALHGTLLLAAGASIALALFGGSVVTIRQNTPNATLRGSTLYLTRLGAT